MTKFNITDMLDQSRKLSRKNYVDLEVTKKGNLRVGSSGILSERGEIAGGCGRKSHLRSLGIELEEPTEDKLLMFDLGFASEDIVANKLKSILPEGYTILREEEIPVQWNTTNGTAVTGRPDMVICLKNKATVSHPDGSNPIAGEGVMPVLGIELKSVHSMWTMRDVLFQKKPKLANLIQAAHYMWQLGAPYKLIYSAYSQLGQGMVGVDGWIQRMFPRKGEPMSEYVEYNEKTGAIKHLKQFEIVYDLEFDPSGRLMYKVESEDNWVGTIITRDSIRDYFEFVSKMGETGNLGKRPAQVDALGGKAGYMDCTYCPLKSTCDSHEKLGYEKWLAEVNNRIKVLKK